MSYGEYERRVAEQREALNADHHEAESMYGVSVLQAIEAGAPILHRGPARLPVGRFTVRDFARIVAAMHGETAEYENGIIEVKGPSK